jgi:beta-glucosidase-like glycosyl hydrolase/CubicO group peptidase (beta-lactamase class C family)
MLKKVFALFLLPSIIILSVASEHSREPYVYKAKESKWVDSVFNAMSPDERLGQLFMVAAYSNQNEKHQKDIEALIQEYNIGGLIFFQGGPVRQANLTNRYQQVAKVPLFIGMDAEWGLGMRLDSTISYPRQMTLGAITDDDQIYRMGAEIARQSKRLGVHINFAPVVDINSNPENPVIGTRSFGEEKENVAAKGIAYMRGLQYNGVMANAKHFPGHGDTGSDSHITLPVVAHSKQRMSETELFPFKKLFADSLMSVMVAHMHIPAYDATKNQASTLSKAIVTDLLKKDLGFKGLVFTDALNMKGVNQYYKPGEVDVQALLAGNDVLLYSEDVPEAIKGIKKAIKTKKISQSEVDSKVKRILAGKYWAGLHSLARIDPTNLHQDLNNPQAELVKRNLYEQAITLVTNENKLVPFQVLDTNTFASVSIGLPTGNEFQATLDNYASFQHYAVTAENATEQYYNTLAEKLSHFKVVVVSLHKLNNASAKSYGISLQTRTFIERLRTKTQVVVSVFGNPYSLKYFDKIKHLVCAYEDNEITQSLVPQMLFGAVEMKGKLPVSAAPFKQGTGIQTTSLKRLSYSVPESVGMSAAYLNEGIDSLINWAIKDKNMPGCQILVAKQGKVIFSKSYGHLTYDSVEQVKPHTIYDIASVTKVAATLQAVMFLHERQLLDVNQKASYYLPELKGSNKENMLIRDILMHQAGLIAYLAHWEKTRTSGKGLNSSYYSQIQNGLHSLEIAPGLYGIESMKDSLWKWTIDSRLLYKPRNQTQHRFEYSDLGFYIMQKVAERLLNQPIEDFLMQNFYSPLGLYRLTFNPLCNFDESCIAPTEQDRVFRGRQIRGSVHDQGAAMMGGVAGHAGLFSNANNLAILMQMNLQKGYYGGRRYLLEPTLPTFTKSYNTGNRRGLGWDRPRPEGGGLVSDFASRNSYGHTGFTGTFAWVDPDEELVYIFLSNRIYPSAHNEKLMKNNIRRRVQDIVYKSIINYQATHQTSLTSIKKR